MMKRKSSGQNGKQAILERPRTESIHGIASEIIPFRNIPSYTLGPYSINRGMIGG